MQCAGELAHLNTQYASLGAFPNFWHFRTVFGVLPLPTINHLFPFPGLTKSRLKSCEIYGLTSQCLRPWFRWFGAKFMRSMDKSHEISSQISWHPDLGEMQSLAKFNTVQWSDLQCSCLGSAGSICCFTKTLDATSRQSQGISLLYLTFLYPEWCEIITGN